MAERALAIGTAARSYPGEQVNGDGWSIDWHLGSCRIALIDGLGHGPAAAAATLAAITALRSRPELAPADALRLCHQALIGTRGAVISLARLDTSHAKLTYAGVGNVEARLWHSTEQQRPIAYRGIVGVTMPKVRSFDLELGANWLLLLHTDGVRERFTLPDPADWVDLGPQLLAEEVLRRWGRPNDDAAVVIACPEGKWLL
jgi:serine phosphatase RsbU (regulator of sigma subunit)